MRVIKAPAGIRVIPRPERDAYTAARAIVADAEARAREVMERAERDAERVRERARLEGEAAARAEASAWALRLEARQAAQNERDAGTIAQLATEVAKTILGREAASGPEVLADVARRALARVRRARSIVLRVHPDDVEVAREGCRSWLPGGAMADTIVVVADPDVATGGTVVESELGRLDARLETQLAAIAKALGEP